MITILGATGSIGKSTLAVLSQHPTLSIFALVAHQNAIALLELIQKHQPRYAVLFNKKAYESLKNTLPLGCKTQCLWGDEGVRFVTVHDQVTTVVSAISGASGLKATYWAVSAAKRVLLANKESLVIAGGLIQKKAQVTGAQIIPIDSEHHALWQCGFGKLSQSNLLDEYDDITKVVLTASGGGLRDVPLDQLPNVSIKQALKHPNWSMGKKITIDSATMVNKVLEVIEAFYLFNLKKEMIDVWLHPQSLVHGLVGFKNGHYVASLSQPDMRVTLASALMWPKHLESGVELPNLLDFSRLDFSPVDVGRYPVMKLMPDLLKFNTSESIVFNTANEIAVEAFLHQKILFTDIVHLITDALNQVSPTTISDFESIQVIQAQTTDVMQKLLKKVMQ